MTGQSGLQRLLEMVRDSASAPVPFRDVSEIPWADPVIGERFLRVGRRSVEQTAEEVGFLVEALDLRPPNRVLDVMCGDGRIAIPLARHGLEVMGIDINPYAIDVARAHAAAQRRARFDVADARDFDVGGAWDVALIIFGHLSGFERSQAVAILERIRAHLPQGLLCVDMHLGPAAVRELDGQRDWTVWEQGWLASDNPALVLDEYLTDAETLTFMRRSYCLDAVTGELTSWGQAGQFYDEAGMRALLAEAGFALQTCYGDFDASAYDDESSPNLIAVARAL